MHQLTTNQLHIIQRPTDTKIFLTGPAGTGKTTVGVERLHYLLESGIPGQSILILAPQRSLLQPYLNRSFYYQLTSGTQTTAITLIGLSQRMVSLFWPYISHQAGFFHPDDPPNFLTLETTQYYMAFIVRPLLKDGYFNSIVIDRNRLYSQIIDNLNKAAIVGFSHTEIGERLRGAWTGAPAQLRIYDDTQLCATLFRQFCLENNLLDFSLQMDIFNQHLWPEKLCNKYLTETYRHLIIDNVEEDTPVAHDIFRDWCIKSESALIINDEGAGYRYFLGADPISAYKLNETCVEHYIFNQSLVSNQEIIKLNDLITAQLTHTKIENQSTDYRHSLIYSYHRFFPQMIDWVAAEVAKLIYTDQLPSREIAIFAPYLSDSLRFALTNRLGEYNILTHSIRPSRSLREEPAIQCLLTLAAIAHPHWGIPRNKYDIAYALTQAIDGLDLVRAQLLTEIVYRIKEGLPTLSSFDLITPDMQERISYRIGECYEILRHWIQSYTSSPPVDFDNFISRIFGELLSQPGFGFHAHWSKGQITAIFIDSIRKFKRGVSNYLVPREISIGQEYWWMIHDGVIAAQYLQQWQDGTDDSVLIAPAHTFLMNNRPVTVQFWLDVGSRAWSERLYQPLTHPFVLSRQWDKNRQWTDMDEVEVNYKFLCKMTSGLLLRCREKVYLGLCEFNEQGYEQRGPLLRAIQHILQDFSGKDL